MKYLQKLIWVGFFGLLLTGCGKKEDVITNLSYAARSYTLEYDYFNTEKTYQFELSKGDNVHLETTCSEGSVEIKIVDIDNVALYQEELLVDINENIKIEKDGRYILVVKGNETKGSVNILVSSL